MAHLACLFTLLLLAGELGPALPPGLSPSQLASHELPDILSLWDRKQPALTEQRLAEILPRARAAGEMAYVVELLANIARARAHQGKFEAARSALDEAQSLLDAGPASAAPASKPVLRARAAWLLETGRYLGIARSSSHTSAGKSAQSRSEQAQRMKRMRSSLRSAAASAIDAGADYYAIDAAHLLGLSTRGVEGLAWNLTAIRFARTSRDEKVRSWLGVLYENTARSFHRLRRWDEALEVTRRGLAWAREQNELERIRMFEKNIATLEKLASRERPLENTARERQHEHQRPESQQGQHHHIDSND